MDNNKMFTLIYKTYKNDLDWLKYSLLSLKKYLDPINIFEIIIYTHDVAFVDLCNLIKLIDMNTFITCRIIPVHYDYHGYIKQMVVKSTCYLDCQTKYIIILDSDLILKQKLNCSHFIKDDGKIEWFYLKKEDDPTNVVFNVWKTAYEDSTYTKQKNHYMSNGFPFVFTKKSLENAHNKFIELHKCNYDQYCKQRCILYKIPIHVKITDAFPKLSKIFEEFEYLGFFCHNYSDEYNFLTTKELLMKKQLQQINNHSFFIQNWSHGGITPKILNEINAILEKN